MNANDNIAGTEVYRKGRDQVEGYITEETRVGEEEVQTSPSGRYALMTTTHTTQASSWNYTRGRFVRAADDVCVADVKRNYSSFWGTWLEGHVDGHDYAICGEDYQGQTFCQLDTGRVKSFLPVSSTKGHAFCWATAELMADGKTLLVEGCHWACPYEFRLFDVADPMTGWPALRLESGEEVSFDSDKALLRYSDGLFVWERSESVRKSTGETEAEMEVRHTMAYWATDKAEKTGASEAEMLLLRAEHDRLVDEELDSEEDPDSWEPRLLERVTLRRLESGEMQVVERWKAELLCEREEAYARREKEQAAQRQAWLDNDELHAVLKSKADLQGCVGFTYPSGYARRVEGDPNPLYLRVRARAFDPDREDNRVASVSWGVVSGLITLDLWVRGKGTLRPEPSFPRTVEGVLAAWARAQEHLSEEPPR
jgi:hypothetical protein